MIFIVVVSALSLSLIHISNVDLKVGDLTRDAMQTLNSDLTAANFGKLDAQGSAADQAAGLINMILETIGVMAILAVRCV